MQGYAAPSAFTITLASLAAASAREGLLFDNTGTKYDDIMIELSVGCLTATTADEQGVYIYMAASVDGTNFTSPALGSDAAIILGTNALKMAAFVPVPVGVASMYYCNIPSVASIFGGNLPIKTAIIYYNKANGALNGTEGNFLKTVRGVYYTT